MLLSMITMVTHMDNTRRKWFRRLHLWRCSDDNGNIYAAGNANGTVNGQSAIGSNDLYVVKYSTNGQVIWTKQLGLQTHIRKGYQK